MLIMLHKTCLILLLFIQITGTVWVADAGELQQVREKEYKLKAAFLLNFAKFITWPQAPLNGKQEKFTICALGPDPFGRNLEALESRTVGGRTIEVLHVDNLQEARNCRMLFVGASEKNSFEALHAALEGHPVVTVGETEGFTQAGGVIEFIQTEGKLAFNINLKEAKEQGVTIHSALLDLAMKVIR